MGFKRLLERVKVFFSGTSPLPLDDGTAAVVDAASLAEDNPIVQVSAPAQIIGTPRWVRKHKRSAHSRTWFIARRKERERRSRRHRMATA